MGEPLLNGDASQCKKQQATGPLRNCAQPPPGKLNSHRSPRKCSEEFLRRSEEHTSELQSPCNLVCRLLLEKKKEHALEVGLGKSSECGIERRDCTYPGHHLKSSGVSRCNKRIGTSVHIDTRCHHRSRVNQS